jgi:2-keto-3-deoxy-L-rhamnonate aldolase RhmA
MRQLLAMALLLLCAAIGANGQNAAASRIVQLLKEDEVVFGSMVQDRTEAGGAAMGKDPRLDFVYYDMERNYDVATLKTFMKGWRAIGRQALLVRIAPVADSRAAAQERVTELLEAGVDGIVFPHVHNQSEAEFAAGLLKSHPRGLWPLQPNGTLVLYVMLEDRDGIENARAIISTPGVSLASPGQGSLRAAYNNDAQAVESAIQTVASTCTAMKVRCVKAVNEDDAEKRLQEGFRVILASGAALDVARKAAGRK